MIYLFSALMWIACPPPSSNAEEFDAAWPQWRGPRRDSTVRGPDWPSSLQKNNLKMTWRVPLAPSYSGPIVFDNKVIVTETQDKKFEVVTALDRATGEQIWQTKWEGAMEVIPVGARNGSWIKATPTYDGADLFVIGMRDVLVCLDAGTGTERWRVDFVDRYKTPVPELGAICSPLVDESFVYVLAADSFIKLDKQTGRTIWRTLVAEEKGHGFYSSPGWGTIGGQRQLLVATIDDIAGVDPKSGDVLWKHRLDSIDQGCILTPIAYRDAVFTSTRASQTGLYRPAKTGDQTKVNRVWKSKRTAYMSAPIVKQDHAYMHLRGRQMVCLDLRTGEETWIEPRRMGTYCSFINRGDQVLALSNEGVLYLMRVTPERLELLDSRKLAGVETWGHLALSGNQLFIRELNSIVAYAWE